MGAGGAPHRRGVREPRGAGRAGRPRAPREATHRGWRSARAPPAGLMLSMASGGPRPAGRRRALRLSERLNSLKSETASHPKRWHPRGRARCPERPERPPGQRLTNPRAGWERETPLTCMHSVMGFEMGGFSIDFPTATVGALMPLFGGVFPLRSHAGVEEGERAGRAARILSLLRAVRRTRPRFGGHVAVGSQILIRTLQTVAAHRGGLDGSVLVQVQQALGDGDQRAVILPGVPRVAVLLGHHLALGESQSLGVRSAPMLRHRSAVRNGNQTLGSHEVHVGGRGHGAGGSSPGGAAELGGGCGASARPALAADDERWGGAAAKGAGARGASDSQEREATSAPHLYVTGSASARSIHGPGLRRAAAARRRPRPAPRAIPPDGRAGRSEPAPLESCHTWRPQVYALQDAPEARREETASEVHALGRLSVEPKPRDTQPTTGARVAGAGPRAGSRRHLPPGPRTPSEPRLWPARTVPAFSCSVTVSQNPITSQSKPPPIGQWGG